MNKTIKLCLNGLFFTLAFLIGKLPLWIILIAFITCKLPFGALICLFMAVVIARGLLSAYENDRGIFFCTIKSVWKSILRPVFCLVMFFITIFALTYLLFAGATEDWWLAVAALGALTAWLAADIFIKKEKKTSAETYIKKTPVIRFTIFLMWCTVFVPFGHTAFDILMVCAIYFLEYLTTCIPGRSFCIVQVEK